MSENGVNRGPEFHGEELEAMGYTLDQEGYERYASDYSYGAANEMYGLIAISTVDKADEVEQHPISPLETALIRHGYTMEDYEAAYDQYDVNTAAPELVRKRALRLLGIESSEVNPVPEASRRKVGRAVTRRSGSKRSA